MPPLTEGLVIIEPEDGSIFNERAVVVRGLAPPGVTVTRVVRFWFDERTVADASGRWSFAVSLSPGENVFTFRIGSDQATAKTITVYFETD